MSNELTKPGERQMAVRDLLHKQQAEIAKCLPKHLTPERMMRVCLTTINKNPKLAECTPASLMASVMDCAMLGLEPDGVLGRAYLIPYDDRKNNRTLCQLQIGYRGLVDLALRSGTVESLDAYTVHTKDKFALRYGLNATIEHEPCMEAEPGEITGFYAVATLRGGIKKSAYMSRREVDGIKARSKSAQYGGPWQSDYSEMGKKTVLKRLCKTLQLSPELADALSKDTEHELNAGAVEVEAVKIEGRGEKPAKPEPKTVTEAAAVPDQPAEPVQEKPAEAPKPRATKPAAPKPAPAKEEKPAVVDAEEVPASEPPPEAQEAPPAGDPTSGEAGEGGPKMAKLRAVCAKNEINMGDALAFLTDAGFPDVEKCTDRLIQNIEDRPAQFKSRVADAVKLREEKK